MGRENVEVVWFKRDLRVHDHRPLVDAAQRGPVLPLYIVEPDTVHASADHDDRHWTFARECLVDLRTSLSALGAPLIVRVGEAVEVLERLHREVGFVRLRAHEETGNLATFARDRAVAAWARSRRVDFHETPQVGVVRRLQDRDDWWSLREHRMAEPVLPPPDHLTGVDLEEGEIPAATTVDGIVRQLGGERHGRRRMMEFLAGEARGYETKLSSPLTAWDGCSRLSPHLAYGTVSIHELDRRTRAGRGRADTELRRSLEAFGERLAWHDHFIQKLESEPELERRSYLPEFDEMRSEVDERRLEAWRTGTTGFPYLDACLRCLATTGWINFRARAMIVTFAAHDLWLPWQSFSLTLARWFVDYEPGIHWTQIQMQSATTGINAIRVYDPVKQGRDHDPDGDFIRRWVPELAGVGTEWIHEPHRGARDGIDYPSPIVDHHRAARRAIETIERLRASLGPERRAVLERHGSRRPAPRPPANGPRNSPRRGPSRPRRR